MKKYLLAGLISMFAVQAEATSTLEENIVECTVSTSDFFEEIILKFVKTQDADDYVYEDYVLDHTYGEMSGTSVDLLGRHEQVRNRIFTTANADADGVLAVGSRSYEMITQFDHSELIISLNYQGLDQDDFSTYEMTFDGSGPVYELVVERVQDILADSELYERYDNPLCVSHFNLDDFVTP